MKHFFLILMASLLYVANVAAGGPQKIAKIDRNLWPYKINSSAEFDFASKIEMLVFVRVLQSYEKITSEDSLKNYLGLEKISMISINTWKVRIRKILISNFNALGNTTTHDFIEMQKPESWDQIVHVVNTLKQKLPGNLGTWFTNAELFYDSYVYEQMRLAALFPRTTSEILPLQNSEISGFDYEDKQYVLTFDDGPSATGGTTDKLIATLNKNQLNGIFFVLGDMLAVRLKSTSVQKIQELYKPMLLGSHGKTHKPHPRYEGWQHSLAFTDHLIDSVVSDPQRTHYFRPPYGQRNDKIIMYLQEHDSRVMLWNIDSQDWNSKITSHEVADRVITLMLLWRRGIILFHDTHSKANEALPVIWQDLKDCGIRWTDVKQLK